MACGSPHSFASSCSASLRRCPSVWSAPSPISDVFGSGYGTRTVTSTGRLDAFFATCRLVNSLLALIYLFSYYHRNWTVRLHYHPFLSLFISSLCLFLGTLAPLLGFHLPIFHESSAPSDTVLIGEQSNWTSANENASRWVGLGIEVITRIMLRWTNGPGRFTGRLQRTRYNLLILHNNKTASQRLIYVYGRNCRKRFCFRLIWLPISLFQARGNGHWQVKLVNLMSIIILVIYLMNYCHNT